MDENDIRWKQRFHNYKKALRKLNEAVEEYQGKGMRDIEKEGLIQRFEYTYELAWNTIKDFYENQGEVSIQGSRDAFRTAFNRGLISNGDQWMKMIDSRKLTVHTYDEETANNVVEKIAETYFDLFAELQEKLDKEE
jgi:nucleotidyltransferase substrate binding protein (TIGR01987 family)